MIDLLLLGLIAASALLGLLRGLLASVFGLLAWALAGWAMLHFGQQGVAWLAGGDAPTLRQYAAGHALVFLAVLLSVWAVGRLLRGVVDSTLLLKGPDRLLGFALGLARGLLVAVLAVLALGFTSLAQGEQWHRSQVVAWLQTPAGWLRERLPELPAVPENVWLDMGKAALAGDNSPNDEQQVGSGPNPEKAPPSSTHPAQGRTGHPAGQARPPSR